MSCVTEIRKPVFRSVFAERTRPFFGRFFGCRKHDRSWKPTWFLSVVFPFPCPLRRQPLDTRVEIPKIDRNRLDIICKTSKQTTEPFSESAESFEISTIWLVWLRNRPRNLLTRYKQSVSVISVEKEPGTDRHFPTKKTKTKRSKFSVSVFTAMLIDSIGYRVMCVRCPCCVAPRSLLQ